MEYEILEGWAESGADAIEELESRVREQLTLSGWKPSGGVSIVKTRDGYYAIQAMVKG